MASRLNPYLSFDGNGREALNFYRSVFGGELTVNTFGDFGGGDPAIADKVMHGQLETPAGYTLMASDIAPNMGPLTPSNSITISLSGDDHELSGYFEKLADGGKVTMPLEKQMWGDVFGQLVDKFGIAWMVNITQS
jgi:PhnB protein